MYAGQILVSGRAVGVIDIVVGEAEAAMPDSATNAPSAAMPMGEFGDLGGRGHDGQGGTSGRGAGGLGAGAGGGPHAYTGGRGADPRGMESYIRERAIAHGVDPDVAMRVAAHEGLASFSGDNNTSFGAFQLHVTHGGGAIGDNFRRDTGLDPSDPKNERATIDYAMAYVAKRGWAPWMGARAAGITGMMGTGRSPEELRKREEGRPKKEGAEMPRQGVSAGGSGGHAEFATSGHVDTANMDAELVRRLNKAYAAAPAGSKFKVISGFRTRAQQTEAWERLQHGKLGMVAPPGHSRHEHGLAADIQDPSGWLHKHAAEYGLYNLPGDYPHFQLPGPMGASHPSGGDGGTRPAAAAGEEAAAPGAAVMPGAKLAPNGEAPAAFIMHHTGGRGGPAGTVEDWRTHRPGIGTQYIMDRAGVIHDVQHETGYGGHGHIIQGSGMGAGLSNNNTVGMEIVARDDRDVTPAQVASARAFMARNYPNTPVYGHGQVNPGHREAEEGMSAVRAIQAERASAAATPQVAVHSVADIKRDLGAAAKVATPRPPSPGGESFDELVRRYTNELDAEEKQRKK